MLHHGIDIVDVARIRRMLAEHGESFRSRCFTPDEVVYCLKGGRASEHFAARFAAKEAVLKALGTGWSGGIAWTDVEVALLPTGQPTVLLHGKAAEVAASAGIHSWAISLSHTHEQAVASVVAVSP